jgi:O-antigen ligase
MKFDAFRRSNWISAEASSLERGIGVLIALTPLFYLSVPHWITTLSVLSVLLIILSSCVYRNYFLVYRNTQFLPILGVYLVYFIAISLSQIGRGVFTSKEFLDQTRWLLGIPLFAFLLYLRVDFFVLLRWSAPLIALFAWISSTFIIPSDAWGDRATIEFMDPLAFGFMNLSVGFMCLVTATLEFRQQRISKLLIWNLIGCMLGGYVSLRSGSRTGWLALPVVLLLIATVQVDKSIKGRLYGCLLIVLPLITLALASDTVRMRMGEFFYEFSSYPWGGGVAADTSVGLRITFYRLGVFYFLESPWFGWGDRGYLAIKDATEVMSFSTAHARNFAYNALFHSEWTTQAVRFGFPGLFAVIWVFAVPFFIFFTRLRTYTHASLMGLAFLLCHFAASFSTEVYSSKGMITFSVVIVSGLVASIFSGHGRSED